MQIKFLSGKEVWDNNLIITVFVQMDRKLPYYFFNWSIVDLKYSQIDAFDFWPLNAKSWFIEKDPDAGKDWGQEEKGLSQGICKVKSIFTIILMLIILLFVSFH